MRPLTPNQLKHFESQLVPSAQTKAVRFLAQGRAANVVTGELSARGSNIMYHTVYWNLPHATALKIAKATNTRAIFSS